MPRLYRTATDKRLQALNTKARRKTRYYADKGVKLAPPVTSPVGLSGSQKLAAARRLEKFLTVRPIAGARGAPITRSAWRQYEKMQAKLNKRNLAARAKYGDIPLPGGTDVERYTSTRWGAVWAIEYYRPNKMGSSGEYAPQQKTPRAFPNDEALGKAMRKMQKQIDNNSKRQSWQVNRKRLEGMLTNTGNDDLIKLVKGLSSEQRDVLLNLTPFLENIGYVYKETNREVADSALSRAHVIVNTVKTHV